MARASGLRKSCSQKLFFFRISGVRKSSGNQQTKSDLENIYESGPVTKKWTVILIQNRVKLKEKTTVSPPYTPPHKNMHRISNLWKMVIQNKPPVFSRSRPFSVLSGASDGGSSNAYHSAVQLFLLPTRLSPVHTTKFTQISIRINRINH